MINHNKRYQVGLALNAIFPKIQGICACGCGVELKRGRRKWASDSCRYHSFIQFAIIKGDNKIIRAEVFRRDNGICAKCGENCEVWEADHIAPVFMGGGACDLSNYQTLCIYCHKDKTYTLSHHKAISSQADSIYLSRILYAAGQHSTNPENTSIEMQSFG